MSDQAVTPNHYQWPHTINANKGFLNLVLQSNQEDVEELFLKIPTFATEKLDGTNIAKDTTGQLYSRRLEIGGSQSHFLKTSLNKVREADIGKFCQKLCLKVGVEEGSIRSCLVYGELMCNDYYDYKARGLLGQWLVFGACLVVCPELLEDILQTLHNKEFSAIKQSQNTILVLPSGVLFDVAQDSGLVVPPVLADGESLAQVIKNNKNIMKKGEIEGLILSFYCRTFGSNILKWKGAHEIQTNAMKNVTEAKHELEKMDTNRELTEMFDILSDVLSDKTENIQLQKLEKSKKKNRNKQEKVGRENNKYLSYSDITIINDGVSHSVKKFDSADNYGSETYLSLLKTEVRRHFIEEKSIKDEFSEEDNVIKFINAMVERMARRQDRG